MRVRVVGVGAVTGDDIRVAAGLGPGSREADGGVLDSLALGLGGCEGEEETKEEGGEEEIRSDLAPYV